MTILFKSDWDKHPTASIHYETKNKSFIKVAEILYQMGVENNAFHLSLLNPSLRNVDPHDPDLTLDQKAAVVNESKNNFWYFLREVVRIPVPGSLDAIHFELNRSTLALYWCFFNHVMTVIVILRQTGKTTSLMVLVEWLLNLGASNVLINLLTKNDTLRSETLDKLRDMFEELPDYMNFKTKKDVINSEEANVSLLSNKFKASLSSSSPKQAEKVGRGFTSPINIIDEAAFIENIEIAVGAMLMSGNAARTFAKEAGKPYGTIFATTAGNPKDREGRFVYEMLQGATIMDEMFYDAKDLEDLEHLIYTNSSATKNKTSRPIINISMSYRQLGYSDEWLQEKIEENISTPENLKRDLFSKWIASGESSPIPPEYVDMLESSVVEDPVKEFYAPYNYLIRWYLSESELRMLNAKGHTLVIGVDTSEGIGRDDITFVLTDHTTGETIGTAMFNEINLITLADFFVNFMIKHPNTVMIIERKSSASGMIDYMISKFCQKGINPFNKLFNMIVQNKDIMKKEYEEVMRARPHQEDIFIRYKKHIGFVTSGSGITSRSDLYSTTMMSMLRYTSITMKDKTLVDQLLSLVIRNNRIDHPIGGHDDMVIAKLLSYWLLINGRNLDNYGVDTKLIMKSNKTYLTEKFSKQLKDHDESELIRLENEFNSLIDNYKHENNEFIARQLEIKIRKLASEMSDDRQAISVEEMFEDMRREKRVSAARRYLGR